MIKAVIGFDDTNNHQSLFGTGRLVRWFQQNVPGECECLGFVRQQLFVCDAIPYTSHISLACMIVAVPDPCLVAKLVETAAAHICQYAAVGSDPGLCVATELDGSSQEHLRCLA